MCVIGWGREIFDGTLLMLAIVELGWEGEGKCIYGTMIEMIYLHDFVLIEVDCIGRLCYRDGIIFGI